MMNSHNLIKIFLAIGAMVIASGIVTFLIIKVFGIYCKQNEGIETEVKRVVISYNGVNLICVGHYHRGDNPSFELTMLSLNGVDVYAIYESLGKIDNIQRECLLIFDYNDHDTA